MFERREGRLADRVAFITGGASGIGAATATLFAQHGANVVVGDNHGERARGLADVIGEQALAVEVDVASPKSVENAVSQAIWHWGQIDILVNNAGVICTKDLLSTDSDEWDRVFDVNVRGIYLVTREVLPAMLNRGRGVIVNMASVAGLVGLPRRAAYCASKGAVIALTRQLAVEYVAQGVRCNCICPGTIDTPLLEQALSAGSDRESARNALIARQPMGRMGTPEDIASAVLYLASDESAFVTGTALVIDGGMLAM